MAVKRIVTNLAAERVEAAQAFHADLLGLEVVMDLGWIVTFAAPDASAIPQISVARAGGSGTPVPDISVEVDDLDAVLRRAEAAGVPLEDGPAREPRGVRRIDLRDPCGRPINVLVHEG